MNSLNIIAYLLYGSITMMITVLVGWLCYKNGIHYLREEIQDDLIAETINKLLLVGYYLINLGYCGLMLYRWETVSNLQVLIETVCFKTACIVLSIGMMHYFNILVIYLLRKRKLNHF